jgi:hypothetical protein
MPQSARHCEAVFIIRELYQSCAVNILDIRGTGTQFLRFKL